HRARNVTRASGLRTGRGPRAPRLRCAPRARGPRAARGRASVGVAALDQEPVLLAIRLARAVARRHPHERPAAGEALAVQLEVELAVGEAAVDVRERRPRAAIPNHDAARAVLALRYLTLEGAVVERVVLGSN